MNSRIKTLMQNTAWFAVGSFGSKIFTLLLLPLYTNVLSKSEYGIIDLAITTVMILIPVLTIAIQEATFRFAMDDEEDRNTTIMGSMAVVICSCVPILFVRPIIVSFLPELKAYWIYIVLVYISNAFAGVISYYVKGIGNSREYAEFGVVSTLLLGVLNILFLVVFDLRIEGYLMGMAISQLIATIWVVFRGKVFQGRSIATLNKEQMKRMLKYGLPLVPGTVAWLLLTSADRYMIYTFVGNEENGLYSAAYKIPAMISTITTLFINAWQISAVQIDKDDDSEDFIARLYEMLNVVSVFLALGMMIGAKVIARVLFSEDFFEAWRMIPCLTVSAFFSAYSGFIGGIFTAKKRTDLHMYSSFLSVVVNLVLNYVFIRQWGAIGASCGTMLSMFVMVLYRNIRVQLIQRVRYNREKFYPGVIIIMAMAMIMSMEIPYFYLTGLGALMLCTLIYRMEIKQIIVVFFGYCSRKEKND